MAMSMQELFYGQSEPAYFAYYGSIPYSHTRQIPLPEQICRLEVVTFDLMVPMCCARCKDQVRDALFDLGSVQDVLCDARNHRVTVTGCLNPAQALEQVRRVNNGAAFWSEIASSTYSAHRYEVSSHKEPHRVGYQDNSIRSSYISSDARAQRSCHGQYVINRPSASGRYTRSLCPAYRDTAQTYYINMNPTIATVEESVQC